MDNRARNSQMLLDQIAAEILGQLRPHILVLEKIIGHSPVQALCEAIVAARLKATGVPAAIMPTDEMLRAAVGSVIAPPPIDEPFDCSTLLDRKAARAVQDLLKGRCGKRGRRRLPDGPSRLLHAPRGREEGRGRV